MYSARLRGYSDLKKKTKKVDKIPAIMELLLPRNAANKK